jgi:Ca2+-binding EF-hand superfamily protein
MDNNRSMTLDLEELQTGLADQGVSLERDQVQVILDAFDRDKSGQVDFNEFMRAIRVSFLLFQMHREILTITEEVLSSKLTRS